MKPHTLTFVKLNNRQKTPGTLRYTVRKTKHYSMIKSIKCCYFIRNDILFLFFFFLKLSYIYTLNHFKQCYVIETQKLRCKEENIL